MNPLKWFINLFPPEEDNSAGIGPFRLPDDAKWMERATPRHDYEFLHSATSGRKLSEEDAHLFYAWTLIANAEPHPIKRCRMYSQICEYWPIARSAGRYFWDGK